MFKLKMCVAAVILAGPLVVTSSGQQPQPAAIPSPATFHGYDLGTRYTITSAVCAYYRELAEKSPRVEYLEYGRSALGRPLPMVIIGSERNLARQDQIRDRVSRLTKVTGRLSDRDIAELTSDTPAIAWIFIVDTDEEAGVNVLQEVAYDLATREDEDARRIRDNVLVVMTPLTNPDSHARYVTWHNTYAVDGASLDDNAVENKPHWGMNTDGNGYGIDVNRDFGWFVSPEMQALARAAGTWRPQLWLDIHSGPNVIFIPPFPRPYHPLWPQQAPKWWEAVARQANENFGKKGWSFNSREGYEGVTSVGFGLSWGMLAYANSGLLYETFAGRPGKTTVFTRGDGTIGTMRMAMDRHYLGIWSLLQVARDRREELLKDAHAKVVEAVDAARANSVKAIVVPASGRDVDPDKVARLVDRLTLQGVEVRRTAAAFGTLARDVFALGTPERREFPAGSYVIDFVQPQARLARALLDPTLDIQKESTVEVPYRSRMPHYDVSWGNLALIFGVSAYAVGEPVKVETKVVSGGERPAGRVDALSRPEPPYAYVLPAGREASYRTAIRLIREGYRLRVFQESFRIGAVTYGKGTFAALRTRNPDGLGNRIKELAKQHGAEVVEIAGPYTDQGITFGDDSGLAAIESPLVAVLADWPVTQDHVFGGIRSVLEMDFGFGFTPVMLDTINRADLSKYTAVVLPHAGMDIRGGPGFDAGYKGKLNLDNLRKYVEGGGTLIVDKGASEVVADDPVLGRGVDVEGWAERTNGAILRAAWDVGLTPDASLVPWRPGLDKVGFPLLAAGREQKEFAAPAAYPVLLTVKEGARAEVLARYVADQSRLLVDGFMMDADRPKVAGRPFVVVQRAGRGRVIYFADSPTFRGNWYGLNLLFLNSVLFGPTL